MKSHYSSGSGSHRCPKARLHKRSRIRMIHADPVIVAVNPRARDLVELLELLAADLAYLAILDNGTHGTLPPKVQAGIERVTRETVRRYVEVTGYARKPPRT